MNYKKISAASIEFDDLDVEATKMEIRNILPDDIEVGEVEAPDFASMVPEEERAIDIEDDAEDYRKLREMDYFSPVRDMVNIRKVFNDRLYAQIYVDSNKMRYIRCCQKYADGTFSPIIQLPQSGMRMAARYHFSSKNIQEPMLRSRVAQFVMNAYDEYYGKFPLDEELDIVEILNVLYSVMPKLPVNAEIPSELSAEDLYRSILQHIGDIQAWALYTHKSYYILDNEGIVKLAREMGMPKIDLLKQLKKYGFLYTQKSSEGYQANARFTAPDGTSFTERVYCIFKLKFFAGIEEKPREEVKF